MLNKLNASKIFILRIFLILFFLPSVLYCQEDVIHTMFLIGNLGEDEFSNNDPLTIELKNQLLASDKSSTLLITGDNISKDYELGVGNEKPQKEANIFQEDVIEFFKEMTSFKGDIYMVPGNRDMVEDVKTGINTLMEQEFLVEGLFNFKDVIIPDNACPGPEKKKIDKDIVLLSLNSQWWLENSDELFYLTSSCKNNSRQEVIRELIDHLEDDDDKQIIVVLHHTLFSNGIYGGHYPLLTHLFPFRIYNPNLWIPLPVIGSIIPFYRQTIGDDQDIVHSEYSDLKDKLLEAMAFRKDIIVISGHEYNFQYFLHKNNHFINSGSFASSSRIFGKEENEYQSDKRSFAKLIFYKDGSVDLDLYELGQYFLIEKRTIPIKGPNQTFGKSNQGTKFDSTIIRPASKIYQKGSLHRTFLGDLNRDIWAEPVELDNFNIDDQLGGLTPVKIGGGKTTTSIRLEDSLEYEYVLRSVEKETYKILPDIYLNTFVEDVIQDQVIGASNPYGALIIPKLADAAGVYHTNPSIVHVPKQEILGDYNNELGNKLYLFEERPKGNFESSVFFGNSRKIISFSKMLDKVQSSAGHHIHQEQVLKSRLFDMFVGDWDRHDDQWRWAEFREPGHLDKSKWLTYYEPIPRDRDQAFFKYEGIISSFLKMIIPQLRIWQGYGDNITNLKYFNFSGKHFDRRYLNELEKSDWIRIAHEMSLCLGDEVIDEAVRQLPKNIYSLQGRTLSSDLKERRYKLGTWAEQYYNYISKYVDVPGSTFSDLFQADRGEDGELTLKVYQFKNDGRLRDLIFQRTFYAEETKELRLFGLEGDDVFQITGQGSEGPLIRIIGGRGKDRLDDQSEITSRKKSVIVYDELTDELMIAGKDGRDKRSSKFHDNDYNRFEFYYNQSYGFPFIGYDPDAGMAIRYNHTLSTYQYGRLPYGSLHQFGIGYAINRGAINLDYNARFVDVLSNADIYIDSYFHLPGRVSNFFGLSNEISATFDQDADFDFFRYDQVDVLVSGGLQWSSRYDALNIKAGPYFRRIDVGDNEGKFLSDLSQSGLEMIEFDGANYLGLTADLNFKRVDNVTNPYRGLKFNLSTSYNRNINQTEEQFWKMAGELTLYNYLWSPRTVVLAHRLNAAVNFGSFNFYQANYIGLNNGLRSFRDQRFGGKSSFVLSNDLRLKLGAIQGSTLPATYGIIGSFDFGRVWNDDEISTKWHRSFGGGFFISPLDIMPISFYYMTSNENSSNVLIRLGFAF